MSSSIGCEIPECTPLGADRGYWSMDPEIFIAKRLQSHNQDNDLHGLVCPLCGYNTMAIEHGAAESGLHNSCHGLFSVVYPLLHNGVYTYYCQPDLSPGFLPSANGAVPEPKTLDSRSRLTMCSLMNDEKYNRQDL